jgi:hypothetical protein
MKRIKAVNGYTIYQATARDAANRNVEEGYFYLFFSSDIRDYGLSNCDWDWEAGSIEEAEAFATGTNYAIAKEIVEETTTAASFEEIQEVEAKLDSGMSREEIEEDSEIETVNDFLSHDCFYIKHNGEVLGLQINCFGERHLSNEYGNRKVLSHRIETTEEVYGSPFVFDPERRTLVLYI